MDKKYTINISDIQVKYSNLNIRGNNYEGLAHKATFELNLHEPIDPEDETNGVYGDKKYSERITINFLTPSTLPDPEIFTAKEDLTDAILASWIKPLISDKIKAAEQSLSL